MSMRESGHDSWRFSEDVPALAHLALYVRDAVRLPVPDSPGMPPPLDNAPPDRSEILDAPARTAAAEQWQRWWTEILDAVTSTHEAPASPAAAPAGEHQRTAREHAAALAERMRPVTPEPPDFTALADAPELQRAVAATFTDGNRYVDRHRRDLLVHDRPAQFPWVLLSGTVEQVAADRQVPVGTLHAQAIVLMVQGAWWTVRSPGVALTSVHAARDRTVAAQIVAAAFASALDG